MTFLEDRSSFILNMMVTAWPQKGHNSFLANILSNFCSCNSNCIYKTDTLILQGD